MEVKIFDKNSLASSNAVYIASIILSILQKEKSKRMYIVSLLKNKNLSLLLEKTQASKQFFFSLSFLFLIDAIELEGSYISLNEK